MRPCPRCPLAPLTTFPGRHRGSAGAPPGVQRGRFPADALCVLSGCSPAVRRGSRWGRPRRWSGAAGGLRGGRWPGLLRPSGGMGFRDAGLARGAVCEYRGLGDRGSSVAAAGVMEGCSGGGGARPREGSGAGQAWPRGPVGGVLPWGRRAFCFALWSSLIAVVIPELCYSVKYKLCRSRFAALVLSLHACQKYSRC